MSIQGKGSFVEALDQDDISRVSETFKDISSVAIRGEKINRSDSEFINKMIISMQQEKSKPKRVSQNLMDGLYPDDYPLTD